VNEFVANFIGRTNLIVADCDKDEVDVLGHRVRIHDLNYKGKVKVSIRPEEFMLTDDINTIKAVIKDTVFLGLNTHYFIELPNKQVVEVIKESMIDNLIKPGTVVYLTINTEKVNVYTEDGSKNLVIAHED